jgi:hypothetical protein
VISCTSSSAETVLEDLKKADVLLAKVGELKIDRDTTFKEYAAYVRSFYPRGMWEAQYTNKQARQEYIEKISIQALLVHAGNEASMIAGNKDLEYMVRAAMREAVAEYYLRKNIDLSPVITTKPYTEMNESAVDRLYNENRARYDREKISESLAKQSLRAAMIQKRREILESYMSQKRIRIVQELIKKHKFDISTNQ